MPSEPVPRKGRYTVIRSATYVDDQKYTTNELLSYLLNHLLGLSQSSILAQGGCARGHSIGVAAANATSAFPFGFSASFGDYLAKNLSILKDTYPVVYGMHQELYPG